MTNEPLLTRVQSSFDRQGMMQHLNVRLVRVEPGLCEIAGGYAGLTLAPDGMEVTTVEYKINFMAAFQGGELRATGHVVKAGRRLVVTTADVIHIDVEGKESPFAVMQQTLMAVPKTY